MLHDLLCTHRDATGEFGEHSHVIQFGQNLGLNSQRLSYQQKVLWRGCQGQLPKAMHCHAKPEPLLAFITCNFSSFFYLSLCIYLIRLKQTKKNQTNGNPFSSSNQKVKMLEVNCRSANLQRTHCSQWSRNFRLQTYI